VIPVEIDGTGAGEPSCRYTRRTRDARWRDGESSVPSATHGGLAGRPAGKVGAARIGEMRSRAKRVRDRPAVPARDACRAKWQRDRCRREVATGGRRRTGAVAGRTNEPSPGPPHLVTSSWRKARSDAREGSARRAAPSPQGLPSRLRFTDDEFTTDLAENRILRTGCERMLAVPSVDAEFPAHAATLLRDFSGVTPYPAAIPVPNGSIQA